MKAWLRGACRLSPSAATAIVTAGRRLESLPAVAAAYAAGTLGAAHATVITTALSPRRIAQAEAVGVDLAETDRILTGVAAATTRRSPPGRCAPGWPASIPTARWPRPPTSAGR